MPTKVEEARDLLELDPSCAHERGHGCGLCWKARCAALESAIREEERALTARALGDYASMPGGTFADSELESAAGLIREALRAEKVRVLEEARHRIASRHRKEDVTIVITEMLSEARAEGAPEMQRSHEEPHPYKTHQSYGPQGQCPHGMYDGCLMCESKEPEPGGGRCPICNGSGDVLADNCPGDCDNGNGCRVTCKACDGTGKEREE